MTFGISAEGEGVATLFYVQSSAPFSLGPFAVIIIINVISSFCVLRMQMALTWPETDSRPWAWL